MNKLYYIKCDDFICDVTNRFDHAQDLLKEYKKDDPSSNYKVQYSQGSCEIVKTQFNKERLKQCLNITWDQKKVNGYGSMILKQKEKKEFNYNLLLID